MQVWGNPYQKLEKDPLLNKPFCFHHWYFQADDLPLSMERHIFKKRLAIYQRSSALSISKYKEVGCSDQMGAKIL